MNKPLHSKCRIARFQNLRVAALIDTSIVSGPGRQLAALATELRECGVQLRVYMFQRTGRPMSPFIGYLERAKIEHVVIGDRGPFDVGMLGSLGRSLKAWQPDIVQTHNYRTTALAYLLRLAKPAWPWIAFFHGSTNEDWKVRIYNRVDRLLLARADRLVLMSERHRRDFTGIGERASVIHNAILTLPSESSPINLDGLRQPGTPLIAVIGRLSPEKGVDVLLDAVSRLRPGSASLIIVGDGPERKSLEQQAQQLRIQSNIHFLGTVGDMGSLYPQVDLVVLPSRSEGLPNVLLEALRADIPVIATDVGAVAEVLTDRAAGIVVRPDDPAALAAAVQMSLSEGKSASGSKARAATIKRFSLQQRVDKHLRLYAELRPDRLAANIVA